MKNKKLFKTLTISAVSLATASAAIVTPLVVMANKGLLNPHKKDGQSNACKIKNAQGEEISTTQSVTIGNGLFFSIWDETGKTQQIVSKSWYLEIDEAIQPYTQGSDLQWQNIDVTLQNGVWIKTSYGEEFTTAVTGDVKVYSDEAKTTLVATISLTINPVEVDDPDLLYTFSGQSQGEAPKLTTNMTTTFTLAPKADVPVPVEVAPNDIYIGSLKGNKIVDVTYKNGTYTLQTGNTAGIDEIVIMVPGYNMLTISVGIYPSSGGLIKLRGHEGEATTQITIGSKGKKAIAVYNGNSDADLYDCTIEPLVDNQSLVNIPTRGTVTHNFYEIDANEYTGVETAYATYLVKRSGFANYQIDVVIDNNDSIYCMDENNQLWTIQKNGTTTTGIKAYLASTGVQVTQNLTVTDSDSVHLDVLEDGTITATGTSVSGYSEPSVTYTPVEGTQYTAYIPSKVTNAEDLSVDKSTLTLNVGDSTQIIISGKELDPTTIQTSIVSGDDVIDEPTAEAEGYYSISAKAAGTAVAQFSAPGFNPVRVTVTVTDGLDFSLKCDEETTPSTKINTDRTILFTPNDTSIGTYLTTEAVAADWSVTTDFPVQSISLSVENPGSTSAKLKVSITAHKTDPGAGVISIVYNGSEASTGEKARTAFYVYQHAITITNAPEKAVSLTAETSTLTALVDGGSAAGAITWKSSDPTICEVEESTGKLTYHGITQKDTPVTITARHADDAWSFATASIEIAAPTLQLKIGDDDVTGKELPEEKVTSGTTTTKQINLFDTNYSTTTDLKDNGHVVWSSSNTDVASVVGGLVTYNSPGTAVISATYTADNGDIWTVHVTFVLVSHVYKFTNTTGDVKYEGESLGAYLSSEKAVTPTQLTITKDDEEVTEKSAFTYKVQNATLDTETGVITLAEGTAPIAIDNDGVVTYTTAVAKNAAALITAQSDDTQTVEFLAAYVITESKIVINGWDESEKHYVSDDSTTLSVTLDGEELPSAYTVEWTSSDTSVAYFPDSTKGEILNLGAGTTTITATIKKGTEEVATQTKDVTITADEIVQYYTDKMELTVGESLTQSITVNGKAAKEGTVTYTITDTGIASVGTKTGVVTAKAEGSTTLSYSYVARTGAKEQTGSCTVIVSLSGILLNYTWVEGTAGKDSVTLKAYNGTTPLATSSLSFESADKTICTVDNEEGSSTRGKIHLVGVGGTEGEERGYGSTVVTVTYTDATGHKIARSCEVKVYSNKFTLSQDSINAHVGEEGATLTAYFDGVALPASSVTWSDSSEGKIVSVDTAGKLTYIQATGSTPVTITATYTTSEGVILKATCEVTVTAPTLTLNMPSTIKGLTTQSSREIKCYLNGVETEITYESEKHYLANKEITFVSSDSNVFTVDITTPTQPKIKFVGVGEATLTVTWAGSTTPITVTVKVIK